MVDERTLSLPCPMIQLDNTHIGVNSPENDLKSNDLQSKLHNLMQRRSHLQEVM